MSSEIGKARIYSYRLAVIFPVTGDGSGGESHGISRLLLLSLLGSLSLELISTIAVEEPKARKIASEGSAGITARTIKVLTIAYGNH